MAGKSKLTQSRANTAHHQIKEEPWKRGASLEMPPAKPGHDQRWIRFMNGDQYDTKNLARKLREGWNVVDPETVDDAWQNLHQTSGKVTGLIIEGMILCDRPISISNKRRAAMTGETERRTRALAHDLDSTNENVPGGGFGAIRKVQKRVGAREVAGKQVRVQED